MMIAERCRVVSVAFALGALGVACGGGPGGGAKSASDVPDGRFAHIAAVHKSKCGACHARIEPGTRSRAVIEEEMKRHRERKRVKLGDDEWAAMIDYLAADGATAAAHEPKAPPAP